MDVAAQTTRPIVLSVDLTDAPRKIIRSSLTIPVQPGPLILVYPKWLPGEHSPTGPIQDLTGIAFTAGGRTLSWRRDDVDMFAFHLEVPQGVTSMNAKLDFLATAPASGFSAGASTTRNLALLSWNEVILYPLGQNVADVLTEPSATLPAGWKFGTALHPTFTDSSGIHFESVPMSTLVDSPLLAGRFFKEILLAPEITPKHYLDLAADDAEDLAVKDEKIRAFSRLIHETAALYASRHYSSYHFLVTLSDSVAHFGLEHHESSDDRLDERTFLDDDLLLLASDLLPHEFSHSWNGKYRRPIGLMTPDYQQPMKGDLLWVYEGLTQYLGDVLAARSGIWTSEEFREYLAQSAADLDHRPGRTWRNLRDTAIASQILYESSQEWDNWRRSVDYYPEGELIWLEVDTTIRKLSHDKKSLNDFCASFFGPGGDSIPKVVPYTFDVVVDALNSLQPNDWRSFFNQRLDSKASRAPLGGIMEGGYGVEYRDQPSEYTRASESKAREVNAWYSLGLIVSSEGQIQDVLVDSVAFKAGLGPGNKLIAINGRKATDEQLRRAIRGAKGNTSPIEIIVENTDYFRTVRLDYHEGEKYPVLRRLQNTPAVLDEILKPMIKEPPEPTRAE